LQSPAVFAFSAESLRPTPESTNVNISQMRMSTHYFLRLLVAGAAALPLAWPVAAQSPIAADGSAVGATRFELQRGLIEIDEQRRRLEASLEPVDSVLRVLAHDSARIAGLTRSPVVDADLARVTALVRELRVAPESPGVASRFVDAVNAATRDFTAGESSLGGRLLSGSAAQDYLVRSPHAAIVPLDGDLPPRDTPLWEKIRQSDYGKRPLGPITFDDVAAYGAALSDAGFELYRIALLDAFAKRIADVRQTRDTGRAEVDRLRRKAAELAHAIGSVEDYAGRAQAHAVNVGLPVFAIVFITLLLTPRIYKSPELQQWIFTSGILLEITTLVLIIAGTLVLALAGRVNEAVIGTVLGGVLGYGVGRGASKRADVPNRSATTLAVPAAVNGRGV
jgi:hypothetical protein